MFTQSCRGPTMAILLWILIPEVMELDFKNLTVWS